MVSNNEKKLVEEWQSFLFSDFKSTRRALWLARADRASRERLCLAFCFNSINDNEKLHEAHRQYDCWCWVERKCREKAEEFL